YPLDGEPELVVEGFPYRSMEGEESTISSKIIRAGAVDDEASLYYRIRDYSTEGRELLFENYNSALLFSAGEREKTLNLNFFNNNYLNLRVAYKLDFHQVEGFSRIYDVSQRRYLEEDEILSLDFSIEDDEPLSPNYKVRVEYYQPGETDPTIRASEGGDIEVNFLVTSLDGPIQPFRMYYTFVGGTAKAGKDFTVDIPNYSEKNNLGYIDVTAPISYTVRLEGIDNNAIDGIRTTYIKFFVIDEPDVLMQPLDSIKIVIEDNEYPPYNNHVYWDFALGGTMLGHGTFNEDQATLTLSSNGGNNFQIPVYCDYTGIWPVTIPIRIENGDAINGIDYYTDASLRLVSNRYVVELTVNDFVFFGEKHFSLTILEDGITDGITLTGPATIDVIIQGNVPEGYNYMNYTQAQINDIFTIGIDESLSFVIKRYETGAKTTYIDAADDGMMFFTSEHIEEGIFPYRVDWEEGEIEKRIEIPFKPGWKHTVHTTLLLLDHNGNRIFGTINDNHQTQVDLELDLDNSISRFYFSTEGGTEAYVYGANILTYEYKYSGFSRLYIIVKRDILSSNQTSSVMYRLTYDYHGIPPYIIVGSDAAELGVDIYEASGTLTFMPGMEEYAIPFDFPLTVGQNGIKYINIELYNPDEGSYILDDSEVNPYGVTYSLAQIKINNDVQPVLDFESGTTVDRDGEKQILVREYLNKASDYFSIVLNFPYGNSTQRRYSTDVIFYSEYNLAETGINLLIDGAIVNAVELSTPYNAYDDNSVYHTYYYKYQASTYNGGRFVLKYNGLNEANLQDSSILIEAEANIFANRDFYQFLILNTTPDSSDYSDYSVEFPEYTVEIYETDEQISFVATKDSANKDCHLFVTLSGTAVYLEQYILKVNGVQFVSGNDYIIIPMGIGDFTISVVPVDNFVKGDDLTVTLTFYILQGGEPFNVNTLNVLIIDDEYFGDFSVQTTNNKKIVFSRENYTPSNFELNYIINEITGVYGVDYIIRNDDHTLQTTSGSIPFVGEDESLTYSIIALTKKGENAAFQFTITESGDYFTIVNNYAICASSNIELNDDVYVHEILSDIDLTSYSNYSSYIGDFGYYNYYTKGNLNQFLFGVKLDYFYLQYVKMDYSPQGLSKIFIDPAVGSTNYDNNKYVVPSGINPKFVDLNNDDVQELVFVVTLDTCYGGEAELNRLIEYGLTPGVYVIDFVANNYRQILSFQNDQVQLHHDIYFYDIKNDNYPELVVLSTPWNETVKRLGGGNILYIVDNDRDTFELTNIIAGENGPTVVWMNDNQDGRLRPVLYLGYADRVEAGRNIYGSVEEVSYNQYSRYIYLSTNTTEVNEGEDITFTIHNVTGRAGMAEVNISSQDAIAYRDYSPESFMVQFREGEFSKEIVIKTLANMMPSNALSLRVRLNSDDFYCDNDLNFSIKDTTVIQRGIAYTTLGGFTSEFNSSGFLCGDEALFTVVPLIIDGIRAMESSYYDLRFSVQLENTVWTDDDGDGYILATGLRNIKEGLDDDKFYIKVEFLKKGTSLVYFTKTFEAPYFPSFKEWEVDVTCNSMYYPGEFINIHAIVPIQTTDRNWNKYYSTTRFKLEYTSTIDNRTYTFYSDENGEVNAQIDYGYAKGNFTYHYKITPVNTNFGYVYDSAELPLKAPGIKMEYAISIIDSVRQSLLRNVLVQIEGINVNYYYEGRTDSETGALVITDIIPLKNYRITVNGDYAINYFDIIQFLFTPSEDEPTLSLELALREDELVVDFVSVLNIKKYREDDGSKFLHSEAVENIYRYLRGEYVDERGMEGIINLLTFYTTTPNYGEAINHTLYRLNNSGNVLFTPSPPYKTMTKNPEDITIVMYRLNTNVDFGSISVSVSGTELNEDNCLYIPAVVDKDIVVHNPNDFGWIYDQGPHMMYFYAFTGQENCIIDINIESDMYLKGKKQIQLASFGTGLGSFLLQPVHEIFEALQTEETPANIPFLNNMQFGLGFGAADFAFEFDEEEMTFSLYMGASKTLYEKSHGMDYDKIERPSLQQLYDFRAASLSMGQGKGGLGVGLGGKMKFAYTGEGWKLVHGEIYFSITASYNYTKYIILPVIYVPAFFSTTISLEISTTIIFDWDAMEEKTVVTGDLAISLMLEIECGIGIKGFLSASVYGQAGIQVIIQMESGGTKLTLWVEGGVRIQIIFWKFTYSFGRAEWSTKTSDYIERQGVFRNTRLSDFEAEHSYSGVAMLYNEDEEMTMAIGLDQEGKASTILVHNVYEKSAPEIAEMADGTKMIAWINYDEERGINNAEVLNFIYYDGTSWSDVKVADDTITADLDFALSVVDGYYTIVLTEVKEALSDEAGLAERLKKSDISLLVFDPKDETFTKTILTDNLLNDRQAIMDFEDEYGIIVAYRSENTNINDDMTTNDFLCGPDANNKLYYSVYSTGTNAFGPFATFDYNLKAIASMDVEIVGGVVYLILEVDNDDNFDTVNDRELVLIKYIFANGYTQMTTLTNNSVQDVAPEIVEFQDNIIIVYRSGDQLKYWYDNNFYTIGDLPETYTGFNLFSDGTHTLLLYTCPIQGISQIFASVMDEETMMFSMPRQVTFSDKPTRDGFISFEEDTIRLYYCADTYILLSEEGDDDFRFTVTSDIMSTSFTLYSDLTLEVLPVNYSTMIPGEEYVFTIRV
ncbi:MAG: hypothetical protein GX661_06250, partial [Acholeplasmataceae bacterium]|nr:hypothetical protein [Acholeplasmataceae bacterium]